MSGNNNQHDPSEMFRMWIQKSGHAQAEFMKTFGTVMTNQMGQTFDPLEVLRALSEKTQNAQSQMMNNVSAMQNKGIDAMLNVGQILPSFLSWGAYKTTIGSNGRISIPEAERSALGLDEGDLVQIVVLPITRKSKEVKQ